MDMKEKILKNNGNVPDIATKYDEENNVAWFLKLETEITDCIEWNLYFKNLNGIEDLHINNNDCTTNKLEKAVDNIIDDINELYTKLENEDEALEILDNTINQCMNQLDHDNAVDETTLDELESNRELAQEARNKVELGSDIDTRLRFTIQKANRFLQDL